MFQLLTVKIRNIETSDPATIVRIVGSLALFACLITSWIGADAFAKFNVWFLCIPNFYDTRSTKYEMLS